MNDIQLSSCVGSHRSVCCLISCPCVAYLVPISMSLPNIRDNKEKMRGEIINNARDLIFKKTKKEKMTSHARLLLLFVVRLYESMVSRQNSPIISPPYDTTPKRRKSRRGKRRKRLQVGEEMLF